MASNLNKPFPPNAAVDHCVYRNTRNQARARCLKILAWVPHHGGMYPQKLSPNKPFLPWVVFFCLYIQWMTNTPSKSFNPKFHHMGDKAFSIWIWQWEKFNPRGKHEEPGYRGPWKLDFYMLCLNKISSREKVAIFVLKELGLIVRQSDKFPRGSCKLMIKYHVWELN